MSEKKQKHFPQGKKGSSRRLRKVDIGVVEERLEETRQDLVTHGKPLAEVADAELFVVDRVGVRDDTIEEQPQRSIKNKKKTTLQEAKRLHWQNRGLKLGTDSLPSTRSKVPALPSGQKKEQIKYRRKEINKVPTAYGRHVELKPVVKAQFDMWGEEGAALPPTNPTKKPFYEPSVLKKPHVPQDLANTASYRPQEEAREEQVLKAAKKALKLQLEERSLARHKVRPAKHSHGMTVDINQEAPPDTEPKEKSRLPRPKAERVKDKDRKKAKQLRIEQFHKRLKSREKRILKQLDKQSVDELLLEMEQRKAERKMRQQRLAQLKSLRVTKKLSNLSFREDLPHFTLKEEVPKSLISFQPKSDPFRAEFLSLQRRNIIEVRKKAKPQKAPRTVLYEHNSTRLRPWERVEMGMNL